MSLMCVIVQLIATQDQKIPTHIDTITWFSSCGIYIQTETGSPDQTLMYHIEVIWNPQICGGFSPLHKLVSGETL